MARINVYLPEDLATAAKDAGLNLSAVTQQAVRERLAARSTDAWLAKFAGSASPRPSHEAVLAALDDVRDEADFHRG